MTSDFVQQTHISRLITFRVYTYILLAVCDTQCVIIIVSNDIICRLKLFLICFLFHSCTLSCEKKQCLFAFVTVRDAFCLFQGLRAFCCMTFTLLCILYTHHLTHTQHFSVIFLHPCWFHSLSTRMDMRSWTWCSTSVTLVAIRSRASTDVLLARCRLSKHCKWFFIYFSWLVFFKDLSSLSW